MRSGMDLIGKPIIAFDTGKYIRKVLDLIFDHNSNDLLALLIAERGLFRSAKVLPIDGIHAIGPDAVVAKSKSAVVSANKLPEVNKILEQNNLLKGTRLMTTEGRSLGTMVDLYFDDRTGIIEGYAVSGGLFADAYTGRSFVPAPHALVIGVDVAFVPPETAEMMKEQIGGIKGAIRIAGAQLQYTSQIAGAKLQEAAQIAGEKLQQTSHSASIKLQESVQIAGEKLHEVKEMAAVSLTNAIVDLEEQKAFVIGKTVEAPVITNDGIPLVLPGKIVTMEDAEAAQSYGILNLLYEAAGGSVQDRASERLQGAAQTAGGKFQELTQSATEKFQATTETTAERLQELTQSAGEKLQTTTETANEKWQDALASRSVEQALGRRSQWAVQTEEGLFIAAAGQIVTETVIERAKIYHKEPELLAAVDLTTGEAVRSLTNNRLAVTSEQLKTSANSVGGKLFDGVVQVKQEAQELLGQVKDTVTNLQERTAQVIEVKRIKGALGRPVNRVILDQQDTVILNMGELITHQAIEYARQAGVLEILLDSVDARSPELSAAERRAPVPGAASLEEREHHAQIPKNPT